MLTYRVKREITKEECDWLDNNVKEGTIVYKFSGHTHGIGPNGIAITFYPMDEENTNNGFYELPRDALELESTE